MPVNITINGTTFQLPIQSDNPPWGTELTDIIEALADVANNSVGPGDIETTTFVLANNQSSPVPITGLFFDQSTVRSAEISYSIDLSTSSTELVENGKLFLNYDSTSNSWQQMQFSNGYTGVIFSVSSGQVNYTSPNVAGSSFSGKLVFNAKAFSQ